MQRHLLLRVLPDTVAGQVLLEQLQLLIDALATGGGAVAGAPTGVITIADGAALLSRSLCAEVDAGTLRCSPAPDLASGAAGVAWVLARRARLQGDDAALRCAVELMGRGARQSQLHPFSSVGLFEGLGGFVLALDEVAAVEPRYLPALHRLVEDLADRTHRLAYGVQISDPAMDTYDVIRGAAGQLLAILALIQSPRLTDERDMLIALGRQRTKYLVEIVRSPRGPHLGFYVAPEFYPPHEGGFWSRYPGGQYNLGLAHGVPGILAVLGAASSAGIVVPDLDASLHSLCERLSVWSFEDEYGADWPSGIDPQHAVGSRTDAARTAWCYGTPGVSAALGMAASALGSSSVSTLAESARTAALARVRAGHVDNAAICHGLAGVLACLDVTPDEAPDLVGALLSAIDPDQHGLMRGALEECTADTSGLLNGTAGVLAALDSFQTPDDAGLQTILGGRRRS
ncbi:lanthionine synthetase C family protein [Cellulomonas soli]|uniref:lanthionine synthetase C family protein n=1 Tax=Cellulomonas soli TaxID=931535 RepID=UPI0015C6FC7A|nr:lanthionine synthetase C family protein [Cellulomonas soli]NYI58646.1 lantibiotic modifying enzyme [Cellulomonas soli]